MEHCRPDRLTGVTWPVVVVDGKIRVIKNRIRDKRICFPEEYTLEQYGSAQEAYAAALIRRYQYEQVTFGMSMIDDSWLVKAQFLEGLQ